MKIRSIGCALAAICALACAPAAAQASRALITASAVNTGKTPAGQIEGACGVAVSPVGDVYVSDYYHRVVDAFSPTGAYKSQLQVGVAPEGPCGLAFDSKGALYANLWHEQVVRLLPSFTSFDAANSTGVAVDPETDRVYVDDRTHVAVYEPSGALVEEVGAGTLGEGFGVAAFGGRVYVPDAADDTVKVYEPALDPVNPVAQIDGLATPQHRFVSLVDAAAAVDPTNGHLLVTDDLQPGYEHPEAAIDEFSATGAFLGQLAKTVIDAEPVGLAVDGTGRLYATSGNSEGATGLAFGPYSGSLAAPESGGGAPGAGEAPAGGGAVQAGAPQGAAGAQAAAVGAAATPTRGAARPAKKAHRKHHRRRHRHARGRGAR